MRPTKHLHHSLLSRMDQLRNREKLFHILNGLFLFLFTSMMLIFIALTIMTVFQLNAYGITILNIIIFVLSFASLVYWVMRPFYSLLFKKLSPSYTALAFRIGAVFTSIKDRLLNALEIYNFHVSNAEKYSLELVDCALEEVHRESENVNFLHIIDKTYVKHSARLVLLPVILFGLTFLIFPNEYIRSAKALLHPKQQSENALQMRFDVWPGDVEVVKNTDVDLKLTVDGEIPERVILHLIAPDGDYEMDKTLISEKSKVYPYTIESIKDSMEYYYSIDSKKTPKYLISVIELPFVRNLQLKLIFPTYSLMETKFLDENVGDVSALKGTLVELDIRANKKIRSAGLLFNDSRMKALELDGSTARGHFSVFSDSAYHIHLVDEVGRENEDPIEYRVNMIPDDYPSVKILIPGRDIDISEEMLLPLAIEAEDDFGFSNLRLIYKKIRGLVNGDSLGSLNLPLSSPQSDELRMEYDWNLSELNLFPEDVVNYYVEIFDNDAISGPKSARSAAYHIRFPSMEEIYTEVQKEHENAFDAFEGMYEQSKELKEKLSTLVQEMKKDPNLNWEEKKELEDITETQQAMHQSLEEIEHKLEQMVENMEKNDLISIETLAKYQELQELMQDLMTPELKNALEELQKAFQSIDPEQLKKVVDKLNFNQKNFLESIEKTISMLKRLQIEQKLDELSKKAEQLLNDQSDLLDEAKNSSGDQNDPLAEKQAELKNKAAELDSEMNNLKGKMSQFDDMPTDQLDAAMDMLDQQQLLENMSQASQSFKSGDKQRAQQSGNKAKKTLSDLRDMLKRAKEEFLQSQKEKMLAELKNLSGDLLSLSMMQEDAMKSGEKLSQNSPSLMKLAERQQDLFSSLSHVAEKLGEISNKTFFITPEILRTVGQALNAMQRSLEKFGDRNNATASRHQGDAMFSLNEAVKLMRKAMNDLSASSSAAGMQQMMEKLQNMSCQQQGINDQTMQLQLGLGGQSLTLQQQAAMARLAAEQAALKKSLEQLHDEFGNRSEILGRLDDMAKAMDDVIKDLENQNVSRTTIHRQRQILSRLLDAQKSIQRRDYSRKRQAETGKEYFQMSPSQLPANLGERDQQLRQDLLRALKQGYTKDYEELIKKYFEAIANED